ncbi:MAG: YlbF family regulator, partial [Clostridia bacterium]|nr:YlbF family regulator [Clostridia bacterium]
MDVIAKARELGALLQQDERYVKLMEAQKANEADTELNELIARIQLIQMSFQHEANKEDRNEQKLEAYDK